jgi:predicted nuclease with TOPRIM domain
VNRARFVLRRLVLIALSRFRRALGIAAQSLQRDEIGELRYETRALGSASVESVAHVGAELREINERLSRLEGQVARLAEQREAVSGSLDERGEPAPQSLSAE